MKRVVAETFSFHGISTYTFVYKQLTQASKVIVQNYQLTTTTTPLTTSTPQKTTMEGEGGIKCSFSMQFLLM